MPTGNYEPGTFRARKNVIRNIIQQNPIKEEVRKRMKITCECGNTTNFTMIKEVEVVFDPKKGIWDEAHPIKGREIIYCKECDSDQDTAEMTVEEEKVLNIPQNDDDYGW